MNLRSDSFKNDEYLKQEHMLSADCGFGGDDANKSLPPMRLGSLLGVAVLFVLGFGASAVPAAAQG